MKNKLFKLEALRGCAALYVVIGHTFADSLKNQFHLISYIFRFGQEAVILFFLLSGFVIQYAYQKGPDKSFKTFFLKRLFRIYIPLIIVFLVNYIIYTEFFRVIINVEWSDLLGNLLMLQDVSSLKPNVVCNPFLGNLPLWSLSYEWWFYMIFFLFKNKFTNSSKIVYVLGIVAAISYLAYPFFINRLLMYLIIWWIGVDMAVLYLKSTPITFKSLKIPFRILVITCLILVANVILNYKTITAQLHISGTVGESPYLELRHFGFALVTLIMALIWKKFDWILFSETLGLFEPIAKISFGLYISHWFLISKAHYLDAYLSNQVLRYIAYFAIGFLFSYVVECKIYPILYKNLMRTRLLTPAS